MDIVAAIGTYEKYVVTMEEMRMAQEREEEEIVNKWEDLEEVAKELFKKVNENQEKIEINLQIDQKILRYDII